MRDIVLFRFCDSTTPLERLQSRRRWAARTIGACIYSLTGMIEAFASILMFGGSTVEVVILIVCGAVTMLLSVPAVFMLPVVTEVEDELRRRGALPEDYVSIQDRTPGQMIRAVLLFFVAIVLVNVLR